MIRTIPVAEKCLACDPSGPIVVGVASAKDVLPAVTNNRVEYAYRYVQNSNSGNLCLYAVGQDCSPLNYQGELAPGQALDASAHTMRISIYSVAGTTVSTTSICRNDMSH